jgi:hypothetical protein
LDILEQNLNKWIEEKKAAGNKLPAAAGIKSRTLTTEKSEHAVSQN